MSVCGRHEFATLSRSGELMLYQTQVEDVPVSDTLGSKVSKYLEVELRRSHSVLATTGRLILCPLQAVVVDIDTGPDVTAPGQGLDTAETLKRE